MYHYQQAALLLSIVMTSAVASNELSIEPNFGQSGPDVRYLARTPRGVVFFLDHEVVLRSPEEVRFEMLGTRNPTRFEALEPRADKTSYSVGRDQSNWVHDVPGYSRLAQREVYQGIDVLYYGSAAGIEYDFVVAPHSDPLQIRFAVHGAESVRIDSNGDLVMQMSGGLMRHRRPIFTNCLLEESAKTRTGGFHQFNRNTFGFTVGRYDRSRPLTIDPVIESSTYLGGSGDDTIIASNGTMSVGMTTSVDFPTSVGQHRGRDIVVSGINGGSYIYGGSGDEIVTAAHVPEQFMFQNISDAVVVVGYTNSLDLPTDISYNPQIPLANPRNAAWQRDYGGGTSDAFVLAITNRPTFTTRFTTFLSYMGGPGADRATGVSATPFGFHFQLIGATDQPGFPLQGSTQVNNVGSGGGVDGFIAGGLFSAGAELLGITYFGGSGDDRPLGVYCDTSDVVVVTGETTSPDFPMATSASSETGGGSQAFVLKGIGTFGGAEILASAVFGGSGDDRGVQVTSLPNGNVLVGGVTSSEDFPTVNAFQGSFGGGPSDVFFTQFAPDLSRVVSSSYYGGSGPDELTALVADRFGNVFAGGFTSSADFPLKDPVQATYGGSEDGFLLQFQADEGLHQATYLGGSGADRVLGLFTSGDISVVAAGQTTSSDFPVMNAFQQRLAGNTNGFITRISTKLISVAEPLIGGKDLRASASSSVGLVNGAPSVDVLVTSSDPSVVVVASELGAPGTGSAISQGGYGVNFDCLTDQGGADLIFSAPGYPDRVAHVECYRTTLQLFRGPLYQGPYDYSPPIGYNTPLYAYLSTSRPDNSAVNTNVSLRPGVDPIRAVLLSSNPSVATVSASEVVYQGVYNLQYLGDMTAVAIGDTNLTLTSPSTIGKPVPVHVTSPLTRAGLQTLEVPRGFSCALNAPVDTPSLGTPTTVKVTSQNPDLILLTTDPRVAGQADMTVTAPIGTINVFVQAVGPEGQTTLTLSMDGFDPVDIPVNVTQPIVYLSYYNGVQLRIGDEARVNVPIVPLNTSLYCKSNVDRPLLVTINNSNPQAIATPESVDLATPVAYPASFTVKAVGEGVATITIQPPEGFKVITPGSLTFSSRPKTQP